MRLLQLSAILLAVLAFDQGQASGSIREVGWRTAQDTAWRFNARVARTIDTILPTRGR